MANATLYSVVPREVTGEFRGHDGGVNALDYIGPDYNKFVSVGNDSKVKVWDLESRKMVDVIERRGNVPPFGHNGPIYDVHVSTDGGQFVTASNDNYSLVCDTARVGPKIRLPHKKRVTIARFPTAEEFQNTLITVSGPSVKKWDLRTAEEIDEFKGLPDRVLSLAFVNDRGDFIVASSTSPTLALYSWMEFKEPLQTFTVAFADQKDGIEAVQSTGRENFMALSSGKHSELLHFATRVNRILPDTNKGYTQVKGSVGRISFSPNFKFMSIGNRKGTVSVWNKEKTRKLETTITEVFDDGGTSSKASCNGAIWHPRKPSYLLAYSNSNRPIKIIEDKKD